MKLYMKIVGVDERISINQIRFDNRRMDDHQRPELFIRINKKYEEHFLRGAVIKLQDSKGNVILFSMVCRLNFRCYESEFDEFNGIEVVARELGIPDIGTVSKHYVLKLLKDNPRVKFTRPIVEHNPEQELLEQRRIAIRMVLDADRKRRERSMHLRARPAMIKLLFVYHLEYTMYAKTYMRRLIFTQVIRRLFPIIIPMIESVAPT